jgi:very-short-patch-repair endonuclease
LWSKLRRSQIGFKFRRQYPVGPYTLDFYCSEARLCIELDGDVQADRIQQDKARDATLNQCGIEVMRVHSLHAWRNLDEVVEEILAKCFKLTGCDPFPDLE